MTRKLMIIVIAVCLMGVSMSLWDTDKNSDNRSKSELNQHDRVMQRMANATISANPVTDVSAATLAPFKTGFFKIIASGTKTLNLSAGQPVGTSVVDSTSLTTGSVSAVLCYINPVTTNGLVQYAPSPYLLIDSSGGTMVTAFNTWAYSGTTLTLSFAVQVTKAPYTGNDGAFNFRYYVLQQSAN